MARKQTTQAPAFDRHNPRHLCKDHNITGCYVCYLAPGICEMGGCRNKQTTRVETIRTRTGHVCDVRRICSFWLCRQFALSKIDGLEKRETPLSNVAAN